MPHPVIALISAVPASIPPTRAAFEHTFPDAQLWNLVDDRLLVDAQERGGLTTELHQRMQRLIEHALTERADGILLTCSMYAPVAHDLRGDAAVPLLAPDDALFAAVAEGGYSRVAVLSSGADPLQDSVARLSAYTGPSVEVVGVLAEAAIAAREGTPEDLANALASALENATGPFDAVALGQFSLAPAADALSARIGLPVLSGPQLAVERLQNLLAETHA